MEEKKLPYSYHTFMFPFIWNRQYEKESNTAKIIDDVDFLEKQILDGKYWKRNTWKKATVVPDFFYSAMDEKSIEEQEKKVDWMINSETDALLRYAKIQFFHNPVLKSMLPSESRVVDIWNFCPKELREKGKYIITKTVFENGQAKTLKYELVLNSIYLKIYNTGIGVMVFETENDKTKALADIKKINDYGRRISLPFISKPDENSDSYKITADQIEIDIPDVAFPEGKECITDFNQEIRDMFQKKQILSTRICDYSERMGIPNFIKNLLLIGKNQNRYDIFTDYSGKCRNNEKEPLYLPAILDDRMYVCCLIRNDEFMERLRKYPYDSFTEKESILNNARINEIGYPYQQLEMVDGSIAGELYAFIYVDPNTSTCQNRFMQQELLNNSVYARWIEYGTLHAVTHHSLMCVTGEDQDLDVTVINPFLNLYVEMALLVLVQRATIIKLENDAAELAKGIGRTSKSIQNRQIKELMDLQEAYVGFQNELLFFEVTAQEQGIEIYERLQKEAYIHEEIEKLDSHLEALYEATNVNQDFSFNKGALILALIALVFTIAPVFIQPFYTVIRADNIFCLIIGLILATVISYCIPKWFFDREYKKRK